MYLQRRCGLEECGVWGRVEIVIVIEGKAKFRLHRKLTFAQNNLSNPNKRNVSIMFRGDLGTNDDDM
jgi:hypothetical protein